ncbi:MAG: glycosyltransferase family 2 protein [Steroidobacteraceae bacterium]
MTSPTVSIVLPTFNRLKYLRPAVDSVFAQRFTDWELIVADDGSEGDTAAYLAALADPPRVRVLRLPHSGNPGAVRNAAWQVARGEYIAFLDSDDVWLPEKLALQVESLRSHPERGWSHTAFAVIDDSGNLLTGARARRWPAAEGWVLPSLIKMEIVIAIPSVMVRRRLLARVGGFDVKQRMCEDYDLWLRLAGLSEIQGVRETLLLVRSHREHFHSDPIVFEDRGRALEKALAASTDRGMHSMLRRERAKAAACLARSQAVHGGRWAALRTLVRSARYSWGYREWWMGGAHTAARAMAPEGIVRIARSVVRRRRGATYLQE